MVATIKVSAVSLSSVFFQVLTRKGLVFNMARETGGWGLVNIRRTDNRLHIHIFKESIKVVIDGI
jgi:hypothetical protein